jgi:NAD(P)-dependent dehydrogenase (short-subunit alcohol dehydrogenase family)
MLNLIELRSVIVSGVSKGIGKGIAKVFEAKGAFAVAFAGPMSRATTRTRARQARTSGRCRPLAVSRLGVGGDALRIPPSLRRDLASGQPFDWYDDAAEQARLN